MSHLCLEDKSAELVVQDLVSSFGESLGFTLIVCNRDAKSWIKQLRALRGDESEQLIQVEPNLGVGEMNSCVLGGKLCRVLLRQDLGDGRWSCVLVDKGEVVDLPEHRIQPPVPGQNSVPRLSLFATVLDCEIDGLDLWTKVIQPKKKLKLVKMRKVDRGTRILGDLHDGKGNRVCSVRISDWLPLRPKSCCVNPSLKEKEQVVISTFCSSNVCYVHRLNRFQELCMLQNQVNLLQFTESPFDELPPSGSIMAVKSSVDSRMYRAVVKVHTGLRTAIVFCLDYGNREEVALGQIFPVPATLAGLPAEAILVQLADVPRQPLNLQCYMLWAQLVEQRQVLEAEMDQSGRFSLISTVNNLCVNSQLNEALAKEQENPGDGENSLPSPAFPLEEGKMLELLVLHEFGDSVTCTLASSPQVRHLLSTQVRQAAKYVAESTESTYVPTAQEVCLAKFTDELWYRALNVSSGKDWCDVMFIDFGNISRVGFSDMRKLPPSFNESPPLATVASLAGLREEDFSDPRVAKCVKQVLRPFRRATGLVLEQNAGQADIFFPELISRLHSEGLLSDERLHKLEKKLPAGVDAPWLKRQPLVDLLCDLGESEPISAPVLMNSFCSLVAPGESLI